MASLKQKTPSIRSKSRVGAENIISGTPIGDVLREARETRGLSLDNVSEELMIRRFYLEALEMNAFHDLPERVYAIGFVNNYIKYLGMEDPQGVINQFKREAYGAKNTNNYQVDLTMPEPVVHSIVPGRSAIASAIVVLVVLIAGIIFFTQGNGDSQKRSATTVPAAPITEAAPASVETPPVASSVPAVNATTTEEPEFTSATSAVTTATAQAPAQVSAPAQGQAQAPTQIKNQRAIEALQSAWVEIKDANGKTLYTGILKATQLLPLPDTTKVTLTTGNAGGLRLVLNGQPQAAFGQANEVKRNILIDVAAAPAPASAVTPAVQPASSATTSQKVPASLPEVTFER